MLSRIQQYSNLVVHLRDVVLTDLAATQQVDNSYERVISSLTNVRASAQQIAKMWDEHIRKVTSGEIARLTGQTLQIDETIDNELRPDAESFVNTAARTLKEGMQCLANDLQMGIGVPNARNAMLSAIAS